MKISKIVSALFLLMFIMLSPVNAKSVSPDDSSGLVVLSDVVPDIIQEIRYYSTYNFVGAGIDGYEETCALMTKEAAETLKKLSDEVKQNNGGTSR